MLGSPADRHVEHDDRWLSIEPGIILDAGGQPRFVCIESELTALKRTLPDRRAESRSIVDLECVISGRCHLDVNGAAVAGLSDLEAAACRESCYGTVHRHKYDTREISDRETH